MGLINISSRKRLCFIYLGGFFLAIHLASVAYVNSSLLKQFVGNSFLSLLYITGSLLSIAFLFLAPVILRRYGSIFTFLFFIALEILAVLGMGSINVAVFIMFLFFIHLAADSALYFCIDVNLEQETTVEGTTGRNRALFLTISNIAWVLSPLAIALLATQNNFGKVYFLSGIALIPLFLIVGVFLKNTKKARVADASILLTLRSLWRKKDQARVMVLQLILTFFYSWMVIYTPLLLNREVGFGWDKIGLMFTIMLLPFLLFELPAGILGDKKIGEKELLISGFIIMSLSTFFIPFISVPVFWLWAAVLFTTRIGASLVEISSESYFFKHVKEEDTGIISLFRMARPLSFIIAPILAIPVLYYFSYSTSFFFLAAFTALGLFFIPKVDTK